MEIQKLHFEDCNYFVIAHHEITQRVRLEIEARNLARLDHLTQVANRRAFDEFFEFEWNLCKRNQFPLTIALVDIDDFKSINDSYGHQIGDQCLREVAKVLVRYCERSSDLCGRIGGDEFGLVWGNISADEAKAMTAEIYAELNKVQIKDVSCNFVGTLKVSIGSSTCTPSTSELTPQSFFVKADSSLYETKQFRKNRLQKP